MGAELHLFRQLLVLYCLVVDDLIPFGEVSFQLSVAVPEGVDGLVVLLLSGGQQCPVVGVLLLRLILELALQLKDNFVSLLLALQVALGVFGQFSRIVFLLGLFGSSLVLE